MKKILGLLIFLPLTFISCKKDKLKRDKDVFIGNWEWSYTDHDYGWCENMNLNEVITPLDVNKTFTIRFEKKGKVHFYEDDFLIESYRIKFTEFTTEAVICNGMTHFGIDMDNKGETNFFGCLNSDTMMLANFEDFIFDFEHGCEDYKNYFVRQ